MRSIVSCLRLSQTDQDLLRVEADTLFAHHNEDEPSVVGDVLHSLPHVHAFFLEVLRLYAIPTVYGRAKKDFVLHSTSGNFAIRKGQLLCGMPYFVSREEGLFPEGEPTVFNMHRGRSGDEFNFAYGGYYAKKAGVENHKCGGVMLSMVVVKMFVLMFTRCEFQVGRPIIQTGKDILRKYAASDDKLSLLRFAYNGSK
jgi:cytochrome P450